MRIDSGLLRVLVLAGLIGSLPAVPAAERVYKSVDENGHVTFSSQPVPGAARVEPVQIAPPPPPERVRDAASVQDEVERAADQTRIDLDERLRNWQQRLKRAEDEVDRARAALEAAKKQTDADWRHNQSGARYLKQSYYDRVSRAEVELRRAEAALAKVRRDHP